MSLEDENLSAWKRYFCTRANVRLSVEIFRFGAWLSAFAGQVHGGPRRISIYLADSIPGGDARFGGRAAEAMGGKENRD